jgi:hypothetical protein
VIETPPRDYLVYSINHYKVVHIQSRQSNPTIFLWAESVSVSPEQLYRRPREAFTFATVLHQYRRGFLLSYSRACCHTIMQYWCTINKVTRQNLTQPRNEQCCLPPSLGTDVSQLTPRREFRLGELFHAAVLKPSNSYLCRQSCLLQYRVGIGNILQVRSSGCNKTT